MALNKQRLKMEKGKMHPGDKITSDEESTS